MEDVVLSGSATRRSTECHVGVSVARDVARACCSSGVEVVLSGSATRRSTECHVGVSVAREKKTRPPLTSIRPTPLIVGRGLSPSMPREHGHHPGQGEGLFTHGAVLCHARVSRVTQSVARDVARACCSSGVEVILYNVFHTRCTLHVGGLEVTHGLFITSRTLARGPAGVRRQACSLRVRRQAQPGGHVPAPPLLVESAARPQGTHAHPHASRATRFLLRCQWLATA